MSFKVRQPFGIPSGLFAKDDAGVARLKSLAAIRRDVASAESEAVKDLESRWRDFVQAVSSTQVVLGTSGEFAGARVFPAGAAFAYGRADFNLGACLSQDGSAAVLFRGTVEVAAECQAQLGAAGEAKVTIAWRIVVDAEAISPGLELHLPTLGMRGPSLSFPSFDWKPGWTLDAFDPRLTLPQLPGLPLKVVPKAVSFIASYAAGPKELTATLKVSDVTISAPVVGDILIGTLDVHFDGSTVRVSPFQAALNPVQWEASPKPLPPPLDNLVLHAEQNILHLAFDVSGGATAWIGCYETTLLVYPATQPSKRLKLVLELPFKNGRFGDRVSINGRDHTRSVRVLEPTIQNLASLIQQLPSMGGIALRFGMKGPDLPDADALIEVLAAILSAIARGAAGLAEVVRAVLEKVFRLLRSAAQMLGELEMLVIVDEKTFALQQVIVSLTKSRVTETFREEAAGFELTAPGSAELALLIDLRAGARDAYAVVTLTDDQLSTLSLGTDLWFGGATLERPAGQLPAPGSSAPPQKLVSVQFTTKGAGVKRLSLVPLGVRNGQPAFLRALKTALPPLQGAAIDYTGYEFEPIDQQVKVIAEFGKLKGRLLPFLASPAAQGEPGAAGWLKQYIEIDHSGTTASLVQGRLTTDLSVKLHLLGSTIQSQLKLQLDALKMTAGISSGLVRISVKEEFSLFGMKVEFSSDTEQFILDLQGSDPRLYLADGVSARLVFKAIGTDINGKHLAFDISHFTVHGGGLDLDAKLAQPYRMRLNGLGTEFTFSTADIKVCNGQAESFLLKAKGKLPPDLLGDVDVKLELDFGVKSDGAMGLRDGRLDLASNDALVRSEKTHFDFRLESMGMRVFESGGDLHFCAFITGSAKFKPTVSELADGMLSKLAGVELRFTDLPVSGDSDVIRRELRKLNLSFVVALDEPMRASLFQMFFFEVRSIGLEPGCSMWGDRPFALVIGGQVRFADTGDVVRAECDFHRIYMAPGIGTIVPRIKCEGLGVALRLGSAFEIDGKVVAVDGTMEHSLESRKPEPRLQANGFMGQGRVAIQGLPPLAASFGFVEVTKPGWDAPRRAWFVFLEAQRISYQFQLGPVPFYLREVGIGLGYYFTYVGIKAIDEAPNLIAVIKELDKIASTALEPAKYETWDISDQADYTLVARAMFSMSSASAPQQPLTWNKEQEAELPNLMLLNAVLAMRKSTFMMTANAWLGYSYYDWDDARQIGANQLAGKQALTGYVILAGERSEFLARLVSNPGAEIGSKLALPDAFRSALKEVQYDATLYMRPGLLHFELGWPNRIRWTKNIAGVNITVAGGAIFRVHDGALLAGLNLEGQVSSELSGRLDAGVVGISVQASLYASLVARIIGHLDSRSAAASLYYSLFALQVRLRFQVSAWLEIKAWMCKITIRASFSFSLQIDLMAELAIQGDLRMGTRMRATIAVSVFGRSLGLSVGLAVTPGLVDSAAARVGRFMNLSLIQDTPSSVAPIGTQDDANREAAKVGEDRRKAREVAASANSGPLAPVPHDEWVPPALVEKPEPRNDPIVATEFTVVLTYPKVAPQGLEANVTPSDWVYITFVPRDDVTDCASFYAAPRREDVATGDTTIPDHYIQLRYIPASLEGKTLYVHQAGAWHAFSLPASQAELETFVHWDATMAYTESNEKDKENHQPQAANGTASLTELFFACFRTEAFEHPGVGLGKPYYEPKPQPPLDPKAPARAASDQERFNRQERGYLGAIMQDPADRRCHEARDFLLHKFASDLFDLAGDGRVPETVNAAHLGLTLLVPRALANALGKDGFEAVVRKRVDDYASSACGHVDSRACKVFNPPSSQFALRRPRFMGTGSVIQDRVAKLQWTLRWPDETAEEAAEDYVKHYRVVRRITVDGVEYDSPAVTVTCADEVEHVCENTVWKRVLHRSPYRYTDDFGDLPVALRNRIFRGDTQAVIRYDVTPVCISDTDGLVCSDFIVVPQGAYHVPRLKLAMATLEVDPRESAKTPGTIERFELGMRVEADESDLDSAPQEFPPRDTTLVWRIFARGEDILPAGQYGADAQSKRPLAALVGAGLEELPGDVTVNISAEDTDWPVLVIEPGDASVTEFVNLIRDTAAPRAWTFFVQLVLLSKEVKPVVLARSKRLPVQTFVRVASASGGAPKAPMQVTALEYVRMPFAAERADVLAPVAAGDLIAVPGRAALPEPVLSPINGGDDLQVTRNVHPEFGAVSSLSWSLKPRGVGRKDAARYRLRSGFDVYALSLDAGIDPRLRVSWLAARRQTAVRLLNPDHAIVTPAEIGDPANWKMRYPSHAKRRSSNGAWYSDAESFIDWPAFPVRLHPLLEPGSELIQALLGRGKPDVIELRMKWQRGEVVKWLFSLDPPLGSGWELKVTADGADLFGSSAEGLRAALRALRARPEGGDATSQKWDRVGRSGWVLELRPRCLDPDPNVDKRYDLLDPAFELVPMAYERDLHPVIEHVLALMRRPVDDTKAPLFEVDRRPAPVVKADRLGEFIAETGDAADPYGWAALDRLGLGVTVRLFDTHDDRFVRPDGFRRQLRAAIESARDAYPEFSEYLFVEYLLQPGAMTQRVDFTHLPDATGGFPWGEQDYSIDGKTLAMARISVRPRIRRKLIYSAIVHHGSVIDPVYAAAATSPHADVVFGSDGVQRRLKGRTLHDLLALPDAPVPRHIFWRDVTPLKGARALDEEPGSAVANEPDAFGQFGTWDGWKDDEDFRQSLERFLRAARNAMKVEAEHLAILEGNADAFAAIVPEWLGWNRRYFEYSADPSPPKGSTIPAAIGAIEQMEPVLAAPDTARRISVTLPEPDGYAHRRAFAVLPRWRYEAILDAHGWLPGLSLQDFLEATGTTQGPPFAVTSIERTAPVLPQAVKSLGRLGDTHWWAKDGVYYAQRANETDVMLRLQGYVRAGSVPGNALAVAFPHHPEQLLDESNVAVGRSVSRSGLQWNFALHAADAQWAGPYRKETPGKAIDWLDAAELKRAEGTDAVLGRESETFAQSRVKVARYQPHWYRHTVQATSAAGTVVAETTAAYLADAAAVLSVPSGSAVTLKDGHPWKAFLDGGVGPAAVPESGESASARYKIVIPAIRYTDTTDAVTAKLWSDPISRLPDPEVAYDLEFVSAPTALRCQRVVKPLARIVRSASTVPEKRALRAMVTATDWSVRCNLTEAHGQAPTVTVSISPLSLAVPIGIDDDAATAMKIDEYVIGGKVRVPGGWSDDWLEWFVGKFVEGGRPSLAGELWASMAMAGVGLPASQGSALAVFPQYLLKRVVLKKPPTADEAKALAAAIDEWIGVLAHSGTPVYQSLGKAYAVVFGDVRDLRWPYAGGQHTESLPWIEGIPEPSDPAEVAPEPGSLPRHLVPELMTPAEFEAAAKRAAADGNKYGLEYLQELWREQKARAWDRGRLQVRATRGDAVPVELPPIDLP
ncbi:hypothetical protein ACTJKJ_08710 [Roseateles sp. 22389]|uniref:hypothetical protein n=1 Tax=Roseateles sp. 22389 TaxID=3453916 RepID=UPI003F85FF19